jgi:hypothetical protein
LCAAIAVECLAFFLWLCRWTTGGRMWSLPPEMNSSGTRSSSAKVNVVAACGVTAAKPPWKRTLAGVGAA